MTPDDVQTQAGHGVTRLVVSPASTDAGEVREQISAFASTHALG
jgi:hypothetical protein